MRARTARDCFEKIGPQLVQAVANTYSQYLESPTEKNQRLYLTWRLRIHLRCNTFMRRDLEIVNEHFNLGLNDDEAGKLMWDYEG